MSYEVVEKSSVVREVIVTVPGEAVHRVESLLVEQARKTAKLPGFRPGKVPASLIRQRAGASITEDARRESLQTAVREAITAIEHLIHVGEVDVVTPKTEDGGFVAKVDVEVEPRVEIENYLGIEISLPAVAVTDEDVDADLENRREQHAVLNPITDRDTVQEGDIAFVTLSAPNDAASKFCREGSRQITVGKGHFNEAMEKCLVGAKVGDNLQLTAEIEDQEAIVTCQIDEIKSRMLPQLDDAFARDTGDAETLEALREVVRTRLLEEKTSANDALLVNRILENLRTATPIDFPEGYIKARAAQAIRLQIEQMLRQQLDDAMLDRIIRNIKPEELEEYRVDYHNEVLLNAIAKKENISVSEDDKINEARKWFQNIDEGKISSWLNNGSAGRFVGDQVARDRALEIIKAAAKITQE
ncbi:MAG: trigger factor [Proteobacteria bacterium]|nr:trigger factor [Pseudomonadota bacterium]